MSDHLYDMLYSLRNLDFLSVKNVSFCKLFSTKFIINDVVFTYFCYNFFQISKK
jgi:hypothetical protein